MQVVPHAALLFAALGASFVPAFSTTQSCSANDGSCNVLEAPRAGNAMMQSKMSTNTQGSDAPLQGRITTALAEVSSLQSRVAVIMENTGYSGSPAALQRATALSKEALLARYKELLHTKVDESSIKEDVATLETETASLKSNVLMLENQVQGSSLVQASSHATSPTSLKTRVEAVESEISDLRTRVTSLEQVVAGLQTKAEKASLMQTGASTKTRLGPLSARLSALEKEVDSLTTRTNQLETSIQGSGGGGVVVEPAAEALVSEDGPLHSSSRVKKALSEYASLLQEAALSGEGTIKERTAALEASVAGLKSKMAMLENQAVGRTSSGSALALLQAEATATGSGSSLKARITGLEDEVDSLRTRVTTLEHVVEG